LTLQFIGSHAKSFKQPSLLPVVDVSVCVSTTLETK